MSGSDFFLWPQGWPLLFLAPLLWAALWALDRRRQARIEEMVGPRAEALGGSKPALSRVWRRRIAMGAWLFSLLAMLQPAWGENTEPSATTGTDLMLCLDVSQSMLAQDLAPNRLSRAREEILSLAANARNDRMGLIAFAGDARLVVPLTRDKISFSELAQTVDPQTVARGGTDLGVALEMALAAMEDGEGIGSSILLLTDGEDLAGRGLRVASECKKRGILVHAIGFGSAQGSKIAIESPSGQTFLRDASGSEVISAMDSASLRKIAEETGGKFIDASVRPGVLEDLYQEEILPRARTMPGDGREAERNSRFQWPLLAALFLWIFHFSMADRGAR